MPSIFTKQLGGQVQTPFNSLTLRASSRIHTISLAPKRIGHISRPARLRLHRKSHLGGYLRSCSQVYVISLAQIHFYKNFFKSHTSGRSKSSHMVRRKEGCYTGERLRAYSPDSFQQLLCHLPSHKGHLRGDTITVTHSCSLGQESSQRNTRVHEQLRGGQLLCPWEGKRRRNSAETSPRKVTSFPASGGHFAATPART